MEAHSKLCVNVPAEHARRLRQLRMEFGLSASSIVEAALAAYLNASDATVARRAKLSGASLRRTASRKT